MKEVFCPDCKIKLGVLDENDHSVTFEKGVAASKITASFGLMAVPFVCPKCGKTNIQAVAI